MAWEAMAYLMMSIISGSFVNVVLPERPLEELACLGGLDQICKPRLFITDIMMMPSNCPSKSSITRPPTIHLQPAHHTSTCFLHDGSYSVNMFQAIECSSFTALSHYRGYQTIKVWLFWNPKSLHWVCSIYYSSMMLYKSTCGGHLLVLSAGLS